MTERTPIIREPIRLRKPIQKEYCSCWGIKILSINNVPQLMIADNLELSTFKELLDNIDECVGIYFSEPIELCREKVLVALSYKLPVTIKTSKVLPLDIVKALGEVPHSAIHVSTEFLREVPRNSLDSIKRELFSLREMMHVAKSWRIFVGLHIEYQPHVINKLDLLEVVEMVKMFVGHVMISFPEVSDEEKYDKQLDWERLHPGCIENFKQYYRPIYETRTWVIKDKVRKEFMMSIGRFLSVKKLTLEEIELSDTNRIRHHGICSLPTGMKPFYYSRFDTSSFVEISELTRCTCPKCGKDILE